MFCLTQSLVKKFIEKLPSDEQGIIDFIEMSSEKRRSMLAEFLGEENAKKTNALIESKLILKNQQQGLITAIKYLTGMKEVAKRDMISKVERMTDILQPKDLASFKNDLVNQKLGMDVSMEEAGRISELAKAAVDKKEAGGIDYGRAVVEFHNYVNELKLREQKLAPIDYLKNPINVISDIAGTSKAIKASLDNSSIFRQGWKTLFTNPMIWLKNAEQSFVDIVKTFGGKEVMNELNAQIVSDPLYETMRKSRLDVGTVEESYPTSLPARIPVLGRLYKASEVAYTAFLHRLRFDIFKKYYEIAQRSGVDITDVVELKSIGKMVNSLTGRGSLGRAEPVAGIVNNVFFSPRLLKSNWDVLTAHQFQKGVTSFVRKQAAINFVKIISGTAAVMTIANAIWPGSVEKDPRSSNFGKVKIGDTRFDVTGGMSSIATLAARMVLNSSKSSTSGLVSELGTGDFGSMSRLDVIYNFFENKLSPATSVLKDLMTGQDFNGNKPTVMGELNNLFTPMTVTNFVELKNNPNSANVLLSEILDGMGISVNTYAVSVKDWTQNQGVELQSFQKKVGDVKFKEANNLYNQKFNEWFDKVVQDVRYKGLPEEDKAKVINNKKDEIKTSVFRYYGFKYVMPKTKKLPKF
jgi:hypothetical protein